MSENGEKSISNKILLWFDEKQGKDIHHQLLENSYHIIPVLSAVQGMSVIDETIDLMLVHEDFALHEGESFFREFKHNEKLNLIPIVVLAEKTLNEAEIERLFNLGINDFLNIPCSSLISRVQSHIQTKKQLEGLRKFNRQLSSELEFYKKKNAIILEFSKTIENDLLDKIDRLNSNENQESLKKEIINYQERLLEISEERENLKHDNQIFQEELMKFQKINSVVIMHSQAIDEDMYQKIDSISHVANTDYLTGIFNRLKFYEKLYQEINKTKISKQGFSIIMFDIDHFKTINDVYGHSIGDEVLIELTVFISSGITETDTFARWGGEEFMILLPGKNCKQALGLAESLRKGIENESFSVVERVTCSFGVTQYRGDEISIFLKRADRAMYIAKKKGRNRVGKL